MTNTENEKQFTAKQCTICGNSGNTCSFVVSCEASIEIRTVEKTLVTKTGETYVVSHKEYALVVCHSPETELSIEEIEKIDSFDAYFYFSEDLKGKLLDILPEKIDLDGDWTFRISDKDGKALYNMHKLAENY